MQKLSFCIAFYKSLITRKIEKRLETFFVAFSVRPLCPVIPLPAKGNGKTEGFSVRPLCPTVSLLHPMPNERGNLYDGKGNAVDFLIDVERKDVGHTADIVDHGLDSCLQTVAFDVVLTAEPLNQLFGIVASGMGGSLY